MAPLARKALIDSVRPPHAHDPPEAPVVPAGRVAVRIHRLHAGCAQFNDDTARSAVVNQADAVSCYKHVYGPPAYLAHERQGASDNMERTSPSGTQTGVLDIRFHAVSQQPAGMSENPQGQG
jgi:hypothetical protein